MACEESVLVVGAGMTGLAASTELGKAQLASGDDPRVIMLSDRLTPDAPIFYRPSEWVLAPRPWHRGWAVIARDATHPTIAHMGYGGGLAMDDAVAVAEAILTASIPSGSFETFEERRCERVRLAVLTGLGLSRLERQGIAETELEKILVDAFGKLEAHI